MGSSGVNKETYGEKTGRRFGLGLDSNPAIIYFRLGKMYRYTLEQFDPESMANFVDGFYKNLPAESIPPPKSPFDDLVQLCVDYLKEYPLLVGSGLACPIFLLLAFLWLMKGEEERPRRSKKDKKEKREANGSAKESKSSKSTPKTPKTPKSSEKKEEPKDKESVKEKKEASKEKKNRESSKNK